MPDDMTWGAALHEVRKWGQLFQAFRKLDDVLRLLAGAEDQVKAATSLREEIDKLKADRLQVEGELRGLEGLIAEERKARLKIIEDEAQGKLDLLAKTVDAAKVKADNEVKAADKRVTEAQSVAQLAENKAKDAEVRLARADQRLKEIRDKL